MKNRKPGLSGSGSGILKWVLAAAAGALLVGMLAYGAISAYVIRRAEDNIHNVLLTHRGLHRYIQEIMHPAFFKAQKDQDVALDYYSPIIFSSSYIVRLLHGFYNEERIKDGRLPIYYKMAADNPRNPVNKATAMESALLRRFNEDRTLKEYHEVVKVDGAPFLLHAIPFLETNAACLRCHGKRQDAPLGLQALYPGEGGFNERAGVIRAVEIIRAPLSHERYTAFLVAGIITGGMLGLGLLLLFNSQLRSTVQSRTLALEGEIKERILAENQVRELNQTLERRVEERTTQLQSANRELDAFAYSVSHDLRSPLRAIDGFSQALEEDFAGTLDATGKDYLLRIRRGCGRMGSLIEDLLKLSRSARRPLETSELDLSAMAREIGEELQAGGSGTPTEFIVQPGLKGSGDPVLIRSVLANLLGNAFKFSSRNPQPKVEFGAALEGETVAYFVQDNGVGFDMRYVERLFGAFQRLHAAEDFPGTGIGLATVQRILARHGGAIRAESGPGQGARFTFTLGA